MIIRALVLFGFLAIGAPSFSNPLLEGCRSSLWNEMEPTVWDPVTARQSDFYLTELSGINEAIRNSGLSVPQYNVNAETSLVSLGEGNSNYIQSLLEAHPEGDYHAVDILQGISIDDNFQINLLRYPNNYHRSSFQRMNLQREDGTKRSFDFALSSFSLRYVIEEAEETEAAHVLQNILSHIKVGGVLIAFPITDLESWKAPLEVLKDTYGLETEYHESAPEFGNRLGFIAIHRVSDKKVQVFYSTGRTF